MKTHALFWLQWLTFTVVVVVLIAGGLALAVANVPQRLYEPSGFQEWGAAVALALFPYLGLAPLIGWWHNFLERLRLRVSGSDPVI